MSSMEIQRIHELMLDVSSERDMLDRSNKELMMEFVQVCSILGAGIAMGMGAIGSAVGEGMIAMKAVESLGRQPKASGFIDTQ